MVLNGKVALVLGAIKGIGLALAAQGVKVALNYFDWEEELEGLKKDFSNSGAQHLIIQDAFCRGSAQNESFGQFQKILR
jgi:3-oxoacyl-[acyl-carrier protein] reductase